MWRRHLLIVGCLAFAISVATRADVTTIPLPGDSAAAGGLPTIGDVQADLDEGRYTLCLQKIARVLNSQPAPSGADRYAIHLLKGECLLQRKEGLLAAEAFAEAAKSGSDKTEIAVAAATSVLVKRSANYTYTPVSGKDHKPLPILNKSKREPALSALFADEQAKAKTGYEAALNQTDISTALEFAPVLRSLSTFELAATSENPQTVAMQKALSSHVHDLISERVTKMNADTDAMALEALKSIDIPATENRPAHRQRKGLTDADRAKINEWIVVCDKTVTYIKEAAAALALDADFFKAELEANEALQKRLQSMLKGIIRGPGATPFGTRAP